MWRALVFGCTLLVGCGGGAVASGAEDAQSPDDAARAAAHVTPRQLAACPVRTVGSRVLIASCSGADIRIMRPTSLRMASLDQILQRMITADEPPTFEQLPTASGPVRVATVWQRGERMLATKMGGYLIACHVEDPDDPLPCEAALRTLAESGLPKGWSFADEDTQMAGLRLEVPSDCKRLPDHRIRCPQGELHYRNLRPAQDAPFEQVANGFRALLERTGQVRERSGIWMVWDRPAPGRLFTVTRPEGPLQVVIAQATRDGQRVLVQCAVPGPASQPFPPPCDQVFDGPMSGLETAEETVPGSQGELKR